MSRLLFSLAILLGLSACGAPVPMAGLPLSSEITVERDVTYGALDRQKLDIYRPADDAGVPGENRPLVVFFYGGFWQMGEKGEGQNQILARALARRGAVVLVPDYRLYPEGRFPGFMEDGAAVVAWARDHAASLGADPAQIHLSGHSAGAYIALMLGMDGHYLAAHGLKRDVIAGIIGISGPYGDWVPENITVSPVFAGADLAATRPSSFVAGDVPPILFLTGGLDFFVGTHDAKVLAEHIVEAGGQAEAKVYPLTGHLDILMSLPFLPGLAPVADDMARFIGQPMIAHRSTPRPVLISQAPSGLGMH